MDSEKILLCYRDDKIKVPAIFDTMQENKVVAAIPCKRRFLGKEYFIKKNRVKCRIAETYETVGAEYLWLDEKLCAYLEMEKMDLPDILLKEWLGKIPFFHTLIFGDDEKGRAGDYIRTKTDRLAAVCVVCYEKNMLEYETLATRLFEAEGIVLQIFSYEALEKNPDLFYKEVIVKGRSALLDLQERRAFWDGRLQKDMGYYSFCNENRLFLDTFKKNRYNTLTK